MGSGMLTGILDHAEWAVFVLILANQAGVPVFAAPVLVGATLGIPLFAVIVAASAVASLIVLIRPASRSIEAARRWLGCRQAAPVGRTAPNLAVGSGRSPC